MDSKITLNFEGKLKKIHIRSNNIIFHTVPGIGEEVEQRLTINEDGYVWVSKYAYMGAIGNLKKIGKFSLKVNKKEIDYLFKSIATYFEKEHEDIGILDSGFCEVKLTNTQEKTYNFVLPIYADRYVERERLSYLIRDITGRQDLFVFDGRNKPNIINRITLEYFRTTKIKLEEDNNKYVSWNYSEELIIDRKTGSLKYTQDIGNGLKISHNYEIRDGINTILDSFDTGELFSNIQGNPEDAVDNPYDKTDYKITIDYEKNSQKIIEGSFDKYGLPDDYEKFATNILFFIRHFELDEIFKRKLYARAKRRKSDYIYCSVIFEEGYKNYYYLTQDDSITVGDYVIVPVGDDNQKSVARVVDIEYFQEEDVPYPLDKVKTIIEKNEINKDE